MSRGLYGRIGDVGKVKLTRYDGRELDVSPAKVKSQPERPLLMLTNLKIENFKTWSEVAMECRPLTGLFGANSSGKSSLIQFLLLLKQTKEATDRSIALDFNGRYVKLGNFSDAIHNHDKDLTLKWSLDFELDEELTIRDPSSKRTDYLVKSDKFSLSSSVEDGEFGAVGKEIHYWVGDCEFFSKENAVIEPPLI